MFTGIGEHRNSPPILEDMATTKDAISIEVEAQWYQALFEEDCIAVMELLTAYRCLLKVGWESEPSRQVEGRKRKEGTGRKRSPWKGRTALHVGASRGCAKLIMQVLRLCNIPCFDILDEKYQATLLDPAVKSMGAPESDVSERVLGVFTGDSSEGGAMSEGDRKSVNECRRPRLAPDSNPDAISGVSIPGTDFAALVLAKDAECGLDALAIATLHGNQELMCLLCYGRRICDLLCYSERTPTDTKHFAVAAMRSGSDLTDLASADKHQRYLLRQVTVEAIMGRDVCTTSPPDSTPSIIQEYRKHRDFNFLSPEEYLFHFMFANLVTYVSDKDDLWKAIKSRPDNLWGFLLQFKDGQGRTPFHVAMDVSYDFDLVDLLPWSAEDTEATVCAMTALDGAGRTPVHRAAAIGGLQPMRILLKEVGNDDKVSATVSATCRATWRRSTFDSSNLLKTAYRDLDLPVRPHLPHTPLHAAIMHGNFDCAKLLIEKGRQLSWGDMKYQSDTGEIPANPMSIVSSDDVREWIEWDIMELACLVGAPVSFIHFLKDEYVQAPERKPAEVRDKKTGTTISKHRWHPLHLSASLGKYDLVKYFTDDLRCDPFIEDFEGNSALHHAMKVREFEFKPHFFDYVNSEHYSRMATRQVLDEHRLAERKGCICRLLQAGCDIFKTNHNKQLPYPTDGLNDANFLSWWYNKQEKEFATTQKNLNFATNAIAVTATLVATASYVGPLQPPMGYDAGQIQYENVWVSVFIVCDTLSFYFAIVAITFALIPSLPIPQQAMLEELQRTRGMVISAVQVLLPSIFFVFLAFASSSISVMSTNLTSQVGGILTIVSTLIGVVLCLSAFTMFFIRLLAFIYPKNTLIRYIYYTSNCLTKGVCLRGRDV